MEGPVACRPRWLGRALWAVLPTVEEVEDMEAIRDSLLNDLPKSNQ